MRGTVITVVHLLLCLLVAYGVLFSNTPETAFAVLACLTILLLFIRLLKGCLLTPMEEEIGTSVMGRAFMLKDYTTTSIPNTEEIAVSTILLLQVIRLYTILINPPNPVLQ